MRALIVADWHAARGGTERYVQWLRDSLGSGGHEARLLAAGGCAAAATADYVAFAPEAVAARALTQLVNPFAVSSLRSALADFQPDAVLLCGFLDHLSPAILGALRRVPTVLSVHGYKLVCPIARKLLPDGAICTERPGAVCLGRRCVGPIHWLRDLPRYGAARAGLRSVHRVVTCSEWMRQVLDRHGIASEAVLVPVPPPAPGFRRVPAPEPRFLFMGRLSVEKGIDVLLRAFERVRREHPTATLRIAGEGSELDGLRRLAGELEVDDAATFTGWLEPPAVEDELARAWALIAPSTWAEPMGLVTVEATVRRVPVIASQTGGFSETLEPGAGLLVPNGDVDALAAALVEVAAGRAFPELMVDDALARRTAERHDLDSHTEKIVKLLDAARGAAAVPAPAR